MTETARRIEIEEPIAFIDLQAQRRRLGERINEAMARVLAHGQFIMGPEVRELEDRLGAFCGAKHAIACASGTDALLLALMAEGIGPGDAVFVPAFAFVATAEMAALAGATPVFVDVLPNTFNMDPESLDAAIGVAEGLGLRPRVVIPVDLFGQPADYGRIGAIADKHGLTVIADAAQSFGAALNGRRVGTLGAYTATSFFPAKPLGCYGDGGAVFTDDDEKAEILRSLRVHGKGLEKYDNVRVGLNSRLDTLQAAILIEKLTILEDEIEARNVVARRYTAALADIVKVPKVIDGVRSVWAQYTIQIDDGDRARARLKAAGVPTAVYYPKPLHQQTAYEDFPVAAGGLAVSERLSRSVLSLPMHPYLDPTTQDRIVAALVDAVSG